MRRIGRYQLASDAILATLFVLFFSAIMGANGGLVVFAVLCLGAALAFRRLSPALSLALAWLGAFAQMVAGQSADLYDVAILAVLYATAAYGTRTVRWFGLASVGVGGLVSASYLTAYRLGGLFPSDSTTAFDSLLWFLFVLVATWAVLGLSWTAGQLVRIRRAAVESQRGRRIAEVEQERALEIVAIEQERNRIARDMHDIVAHSLAVVIAQADGARYAKNVDPDAVDEALRTISGTAREALGEVRVLLTQLRHSEGSAPAPELADLDKLIGQVRAAGLPIDLVETGEPAALGGGQQLAVYRIVQEALTNALRHGDRSLPARVELDWHRGGLALRVVNRVRPVQAATTPVPIVGAGHGIAGMRERAQLAGGVLQSGRSGEDWVVAADLPYAPTGAVPLPSPPGWSAPAPAVPRGTHPYTPPALSGGMTPSASRDRSPRSRSSQEFSP
ncbi:histidine kinase [Planctomonas deserti]|uniref:histidine kinase n=1 Tax=Planctomonas deserti TaxID=2144185 RepID=UPI001F0C6EF2|nr:histidine kinase [Planctomonas deserti]